jgi:hypothetical protein
MRPSAVVLVHGFDPISQIISGEVVSIDGKMLCGSDDKTNGKSALPVVSAFATANRLCLGHVVGDEKRNK